MRSNRICVKPIEIEIVAAMGTFFHLSTTCIKLSISRFTTNKSTSLTIIIFTAISTAMRKGFYSTFRKCFAINTYIRMCAHSLLSFKNLFNTREITSTFSIIIHSFATFQARLMVGLKLSFFTV